MICRLLNLTHAPLGWISVGLTLSYSACAAHWQQAFRAAFSQLMLSALLFCCAGLDRVVVAVIDSGVELANGGVGASLWTNAAEVAADSVDNDGNGRFQPHKPEQPPALVYYADHLLAIHHRV
jgi:hypothetical protein